MTITKKNLKQKVEQISNSFPSFSTLGSNKIGKVVGPFFIGVELQKLSSDFNYRPLLCCYPIWKNSFAACFESPLLLKELVRKSGMQYTIPYDSSGTLFNEMVADIDNELKFTYCERVCLHELLNFFESHFNSFLVRASPVAQASLFEAEIVACLFAQDLKTSLAILQRATIQSKAWRPELFNWKYGDLSTWIDSLAERVKKFEQGSISASLLRDRKVDLLNKSAIIS